MRKLIFLISAICISYTTFSQQTERVNIEDLGFMPNKQGSSDGNVYLTQEYRLKQIIKRHIEINSNKFPGWRVQIYFGSGSSSKNNANATKNKFMNRYGNKYGAYILWEAPYFKVLVGDFRTKAEAMNFEQKLKKDYSSTWVKHVDLINYPDKINIE